MTNDEIPHDEGMTNSEARSPNERSFRSDRIATEFDGLRHSSFGFLSSFVIRHSSFRSYVDRCRMTWRCRMSRRHDGEHARHAGEPGGLSAGRSPISIAIGGWVFLEENFSGSPKAEACAGAVVE